MAAVWSDEQDALLLARRNGPSGGKPRAWSAVYPIGPHGKTACQRRHAFLMSDKPKPEVRTGRADEAPAADRDGLAWLAKKRKLSGAQLLEAAAYRAAFREADGASMKSCLAGGGVVVQGGKADFGQGSVAGMTEARRRLFVARWQVLRGQADMLSVMDGVCGLGWTVRDLAAGDQGRAGELVAVLKVALDLLIAHRGGVKVVGGVMVGA